MGKKFSILLSAALLLSTLTACRTGSAEDPPAFSSPPVSSFDGSVFTDTSDQPLPEPEPEKTVEYDPAHTLNIKNPSVSPGALELPVRGATGYASVQLPIWEEIPEELELPQDPSGDPVPEQPDVPGDGSSQPPADPSTQPPADTSAQPSSDPAAQSPADTATQPPADSSAQPSADPAAQPPADASTQPTGDGVQTPSSPEDEPIPSSPFLPDFIQGDESLPAHEPTVGPDGEIIYAPGEEPLPEQPEPEVDPFEGALAVLDPGAAFLILEEDDTGEWWRVNCGEDEGWIENRLCLINLPDVIPSMVYNATNSYGSKFVSLGKPIPGVTGRSFYPRGSYNKRLERNEFMMPVLYSMSKRICLAQQAALAQGNTLVLYEGYRPHSVQTTVYKALTALSRKDSRVKQAVTGSPWNISWFIAGGYSNHQRGFAIDVSLARVERAELQTIADREVVRVRAYQEYAMPTPIHELSQAAATFTRPVASHSPTAWRSAQLTDTMSRNQPALALQHYCTEAGLTPLASEWWHFNDLETRSCVLDNLSTGGYQISRCLSTAP